MIVVDENAELSGQDSTNFIKQRKNLLDQTGVQQIGAIFIAPDIDFRALGRSLDLGLEWFGAWYSKNATRFVVYDYAERPLYVAAIQRSFLWTEEPYLSYRKRKFSMLDDLKSSGGSRSARHSTLWEKYYAIIKEAVKERYEKVPSIATIESLAIHDLKLNMPSTKWCRQVCSRVRDDLREEAYVAPTGIAEHDDSNDSFPIVGDTFETILQETIVAYLARRIGDNARKIALYYFSQSTPSYSDVRDMMELTVRSDAVGKAIRDALSKTSNTDWGNIGELAVQVYLQRRFPAHTDLFREERCGCLSPQDNGHDLAIRTGPGPEDFVAVNVKLFVRETNERPIHVSPEFKHEPSAAVVISSRPLRVNVIAPVQGEYESLAQARREGRVLSLDDWVSQTIVVAPPPTEEEAIGS